MRRSETMRMNPLHIEAVAARKAKIVGWKPYRWELIGSDSFAITGGVPRPRVSKRGLRKGKKTWGGMGTTEIVTMLEARAEHDRYELETGRCGACMGDGKVYAGWHHVNGVRYNKCLRCEGGGAAPKKSNKE